tara:strand:- start:1418 stop:2671 length:1254 start_codon:yes stop_codon:yes gene_type:complete
MNMSSVKKDKNLLSRRGFLNGAIAGTGTIILSDRLAIAQNMLMGSSELSINDVQGWGEKPGFVNIGMNENPHGPSPMAIRAVADNLMDANRYDFSSPMKLNTSIGEYHGLPKVERETTWWGPSSFYPVYCEGGSSYILRQIAVHYGIRNGVGEIIEAIPAYGAISREINNYSRRVGAEVNIKRIETTKNLKHDLGKMLDAVTSETTLIVITNPNNPTGTIVSHEEIESFVEAVPENIIILIDEAYIDFVREPGYQDCIDLSQKYNNVIVTRTFSKVFGLAGMRVGYAVGNIDLMEDLSSFGNSGGIGSINCYAAIAALKDRAFVRRVLRVTNEMKEYFYTELESIGLDYIPSHSNFVLANVGQDGAELQKKMFTRNIQLSRLGMATNERLKNYIRVTMGTPDEMQVAVRILKEELAT